MTEPKRKMICRNCGSDRVLRDAYAEWNVDTQEWELANVYDYAICTSDRCDGNETRIEEVSLVGFSLRYVIFDELESTMPDGAPGTKSS